MAIDLLLKALFGTMPVLTFLGALVHFDSFKLVRLPIVLFTLAAGGAAAVAAYFINQNMMGALDLQFSEYMHFGAPVMEEMLTALVVIVLIQTHRIGFAFDAAILGFAAGTGFALIENFYYLAAQGDTHLAIWVIRGFGTAIMHGGSTAIFAMLGHILSLRTQNPTPFHYLPGFTIAVTLHSGFNYFLVNPVIATIVMMLALPAAMAFFLRRDQKSIHHWLEVDFKEHKKLLDEIRSGHFEESDAGRFLKKMHERFDSAVVAKMVRYLELHTELILAAETLLEAHERGEDKHIDEVTKEKLMQLHAVEEEIGKTAMLALRPHLHFNRHEFWEIYMLEKEAGMRNAHAH